MMSVLGMNRTVNHSSSECLSVLLRPDKHCTQIQTPTMLMLSGWYCRPRLRSRVHCSYSISQSLSVTSYYVSILYACFPFFPLSWGTDIRGLMRGMVTHPQGYQELFVVRDKVVRPQVSLG